MENRLEELAPRSQRPSSNAGRRRIEMPRLDAAVERFSKLRPGEAVRLLDAGLNPSHDEASRIRYHLKRRMVGKGYATRYTTFRDEAGYLCLERVA